MSEDFVVCRRCGHDSINYDVIDGVCTYCQEVVRLSARVAELEKERDELRAAVRDVRGLLGILKQLALRDDVKHGIQECIDHLAENEGAGDMQSSEESSE